MPRYLLDSDTCIYISKHRPPQVRERFAKLERGDAAMSIVTFGELCFGAWKSHRRDEALSNLYQLAELIEPIPIDGGCAEAYGEIGAVLEKKGKPIGANDLWIAAQAVAYDFTLVTNNVKEFGRVPRLRHENWIRR